MCAKPRALHLNPAFRVRGRIVAEHHERRDGLLGGEVHVGVAGIGLVSEDVAHIEVLRGRFEQRLETGCVARVGFRDLQPRWFSRWSWREPSTSRARRAVVSRRTSRPSIGRQVGLARSRLGGTQVVLSPGPRPAPIRRRKNPTCRVILVTRASAVLRGHESRALEGG